MSGFGQIMTLPIKKWVGSDREIAIDGVTRVFFVG